jgi:hypothetical protein
VGAAAIHVQLVCDGLVVTITQGSVIYDWGRERREVRTGNDPFVTEDSAFLDAVRRNEPAVLLSSYADALRTHQLCCDMRDAARCSIHNCLTPPHKQRTLVAASLFGRMSLKVPLVVVRLLG